MQNVSINYTFKTNNQHVNGQQRKEGGLMKIRT
jgi:hypothetical protein